MGAKLLTNLWDKQTPLSKKGELKSETWLQQARALFVNIWIKTWLQQARADSSSSW